MTTALADEFRRFLARFLLRLRDHRFWIVQALVLAITAVHAALEADSFLGHQTSLYFVPASAYLIPVTYAALNFGIEGALPTALWSALLAVPNIVLWHSGLQAAGETLELATMIALAIVIARRVDRETQAKQRAEEVSGRLAQLNATAAAIGRSLDPARVVGDTLDSILGQQRADVAWIAFGRGCCPEFPLLTVRGTRAPEAESLPHAYEELTQRVLGDGTARPRPDAHNGAGGGAGDVLVVPIRSPDATLGALGMASRAHALSADDLSLLDAVSHQLAVALDNVHHYHEERRALAELRRAQENLLTYLRMATNAQEEERKRLARELHDDTLQSLVVIKGTVDALGASRGLPAATAARLLALEQMVDAAVENIRRFSRDLRPSVLDDLGLVQAVDWLLTETARRTGMAVRLEVHGEVQRLRGDTEVAVFRVVQEALRNVERHACAASATVTLDAAGDAFVVRIVDDGQGFDRAQQQPAGDGRVGLGLMGMEERAKIVGGQLRIASEPGTGTCVTLELAPERSPA
ncbi:MAG: GAF domain-containing sensor histidine kinase [Chloroflexota bacterium]|nr:GAF domain-containing sensor histidine kinase [Chloroflexota bacterium]